VADLELRPIAVKIGTAVTPNLGKSTPILAFVTPILETVWQTERRARPVVRCIRRPHNSTANKFVITSQNVLTGR